MDDADPRLPDDDRPIPMTMDERTVWAYLGIVMVTSGTYLVLVVTRVLTHPVEEISWVRPMLWAIGLSVTATVISAVLSATAARSGARSRGPDGEVGPLSDVRDREIDRRGQRASSGVLGAGFGAALVLAMFDADTFWIGNALFVFGTVGAIVETTTKIRLYRRGL
jgi:hypothetical protein